MSKKQFSVYGIGNAIMDLQLQVEEEALKKFALKKGTARLVDAVEQKKLLESFHAANVHQASGGSVANTMIALAQLGSKVGFSAVLGNDPFGKFYGAEMEQLGVVLHQTTHPHEATGTCVILITPDAERTMNTHLGATASFGEKHVSESSLKESDWLYIEGYLFASPSGREAIKHAIRLAKGNGVKIAITFSDVFIVEGFGEALRAATAEADLVFANVKEASAFTAETAEEAIFAKMRSVAPNAIVTLRERGALVNYQGKEFHVPAYQVAAVDETGAGDMFAGGFLAGIAQGLGAEQSAKMACFLASKVVAQLGPRLKGDPKAFSEMKHFLAA